MSRIIIVGLLCVIALLSIKTCNNRGEKLNQIEQVVQLQHDTIVRIKDVVGREHAKASTQQADIDVLKSLYQAQIDSISNLVGIKVKQIESVAMAGVKTSGSIKPNIDTVYIDSSKTGAYYNLDYDDKFLTLNGRIGKDSFIKYQYRDSLVFTTFRDKRTIKVDAFSLNPNTTITGLTSLRIPLPRRKRLGIGPYVGYGYANGKWLPNAGVSVHYSLFQF